MNEIIEITQYVGSIKDELFWTKMKKWLENTYSSPEMEVQISSKFTKEEKKYQEYTKRQLQFIAQVDEEEKIDYYANITRSWLLGYVDTSLYFKMSYLLRIFTLEELEYLKNNYKEENISHIDFYIREFSLYGLIDVMEVTNLGNSIYKYSNLAEIFVSYGLTFDEDRKVSSEKHSLKELKVNNTKTCLEWIEL